MSNDDLANAINAINFVRQLFQTPSSQGEEELRHLLNAVQQRLQKLHAERGENSTSEHK